MADHLKYLLFLLNSVFLLVICQDENNQVVRDEYLQSKDFVFWPNATIPFFINLQHYDHEQSLAIMTALSLFAFKTCLKFVPVMVPPEGDDHVLLFQNPKGLRKCVLDTDGHSTDGPHIVVLGYECLRSPDIDMTIMRALGFPFEHNRAIRDIYIDVQLENIKPSDIELYTKDHKLPMELRSLPYDFNSVMHFGIRDHTKNGHRTFLFKRPNMEQQRYGLSAIDLRKIELVYGPECRHRDRQEKIELCQNYPGVARKKREIETIANISLRVNPDITPPPANSLTDKLDKLGIDNEVQDIIEQVYSVASVALKKVKEKHCKDTNAVLRTNNELERNHSDVLIIVESIVRYAQSMVEKAEQNLTIFCENSKSDAIYQRASCPFFDPSRCVQSYFKSTKSGAVKYSTNHRPPHRQSTKHESVGKVRHYHESWLRAGDNETVVETTTASQRKKREVKKVDLMGTTVIIDRSHFYPRASNKTRSRRSSENVTEVKIIEAAVPVPVTDVNVKDLEGNETKDSLRMRTVVPGDTPRLSSNKQASKTRTKRSSENLTEVKVIEAAAPVPVTKVKVKDLEGNETKDSLRMRTMVSGDTRRFSSIKHAKSRSEQNITDSDVSLESDTKKNNMFIEDVPEVDQEVEEPRIRSKKKARKGKGREGKTREKKEKKKRPPPGYTPRAVHLSKKNKEFYGDRRWPGGVVYYLVQDTTQYDLTDMTRRLEEVNDILKQKTCARLQEIRKSETNKFEDYLYLDDSPDFVTGRVGGRQTFGVIELFEGGQHKQHAAMMVMAMLGFYFEVARHDRDNYIRVHMRHVRPDKLHHFEKIRQDATFPLPYDYQSAAHPAWQFWRQIGKTGISTVATFKEQDPDGATMKSLGQNEELLSENDLIKINSIYGTKCFYDDDIEYE